MPTPLVLLRVPTPRTPAPASPSPAAITAQVQRLQNDDGRPRLYGADIKKLAEEMAAAKRRRAAPARSAELNLVPEYIARVISDVKLARPHEDRGRLRQRRRRRRRAQAAARHGLRGRPSCSARSTATSPTTIPIPANPHNLQDLIRRVKPRDAELGLAFDGDGDRLGVVTKDRRRSSCPTARCMLFAQDVLSPRCPAAPIVYDVKCSRHGGLAIEPARAASR